MATQYEYFATTGNDMGQLGYNSRVVIDGKVVEGEIRGSAKRRFLATLCAGFGENSTGEVTEIAATRMCLPQGQKQFPFSMSKAYYAANRAVFDFLEKNDALGSKGATVATLSIDEEGYLVFNAGDVRIYSVVDGKFKQLTKDHVSQYKGASMQEFGLSRPSLTQHLGLSQQRFSVSMAGDVSKSLEKGIFLICTEGIYGSLEQETIANVLSKDQSSPKEKSEWLLALSKKNEELPKKKGMILIEAWKDE